MSFYGMGQGETPTGLTGWSNWADPFSDAASRHIPTSAPAMLRHAEYFGVSQETFTSALHRVAAYFITDIKLTGDVSDDEQRKYRDYLIKDVGMLPFLLETAVCMLVYGNAYCSVIEPFIRFLVCRKSGCRAVYAFDRFSADENKSVYKFAWRGGMCGHCPACGYNGEFDVEDKKDTSRPVILKLWNPHDIRVHHVEWTGQPVEYDWIIPAEFRTEVQRGDQHVLAETPMEVLNAVRSNQNFRFARDFIYHWRDTHLAGIRSRGLGIPKALINYRMLYYLQTIRRFNEALAMGHLTPLRVVSPAPGSGGAEPGDTLRNLSQANMQSRFFRMLSTHRADPNSWHYSPVPFQYQALGADARQLAPRDLMDQATDTILNGVGVPVELYKGSLQVTAAPVALRLFERFWAPMVYGFNRLLSFLVDKIVMSQRWEAVEAELESVTLVDAIEKSQLRVQMAMSGLTSRTSALKAVDLDFGSETKQKLEDQRTEALAQAKFEREMSGLGLDQQFSQAVNPLLAAQQGGQGGQGGDPQAAAGGAAPPGGGATGAGGGPPPVPSPGKNMDPIEYMELAKGYASWLLQQPESVRLRPLLDLKRSNPLFHAAVRRAMEDMRSEARTQGQAMVLSGQQGVQPPAGM